MKKPTPHSPCKGGWGDFQRCSKNVTLTQMENEPSQ